VSGVALGIRHHRRGGVPQQRAAAQHRHSEDIEDGISQRCRTEDQPRLELAGRRVEPGVHDPRVRSAGREAHVFLGFEEHNGGSAPRERQGTGAAHHAATDDGYVSVHDSIVQKVAWPRNRA
jgi:hypothetical protein